jgi:hypothetical protein
MISQEQARTHNTKLVIRNWHPLQFASGTDEFVCLSEKQAKFFQCQGAVKIFSLSFLLAPVFFLFYTLPVNKPSCSARDVGLREAGQGWLDKSSISQPATLH